MPRIRAIWACEPKCLIACLVFMFAPVGGTLTLSVDKVQVSVKVESHQVENEMKIAIYKTIQSGQEMEWQATKYREEDESMVRVTEIVDIDFVRLSDDVIVPKQVAGLNKAKNAADIAHHAVIKIIDDKIANLLAITDQSQ